MPQPEDESHRFETEHAPVLVREVVAHLCKDESGADDNKDGNEDGNEDANGTYLDLTVGLGGHLLALSDQLGPRAMLIGFDRDPDALTVAARRLEGRRQKEQKVRLIHSSFAQLGEHAGEPGLVAVVGILLDLGLSSRQLNDATRGFAFRLDGPLDMRFDSGDRTLPTATDLIARATVTELADIFFNFGEERHSRRFARAIEHERNLRPIATTADLVAVLEPLVPFRERNRTLARLFQALRIAVNRELEQVARVLPVAVDLLKSGGRMAVITYHSLEDRLVKQFFRTASGYRGGKYTIEQKPTIRLITKKPIEPSENELNSNNRARSAKLRVVEKL